MVRRRILMACPNYWTSPFQVGSHSLAREFVRAGWDVAFVSDPISPLHLAKGINRDLARRLAIYSSDGTTDQDGRLWAYTPASLLVPHDRPMLRSETVHRNWHRWTVPNVIRKVWEKGFGEIDLLYIDSVWQSFWLDFVQYKHSIYRLTDYTPHFHKFTPAAGLLEKELAQRVDLLLYPSRSLENYVEELAPRERCYFPNGVEYEHFARRRKAVPLEYAEISGPIAVYVGVILEWFHFDWIRQAAKVLPDVSFVLIGPDGIAKNRLRNIDNVHILGCRDYSVVPAYLQYADVGIMPFNASVEPSTVECLNPLKLYQYFAAGLPVVASEWTALRNLDCPAALCRTAEEFAGAIRLATEQPQDTRKYQRFARQSDWNCSVRQLLAQLGYSSSSSEDRVELEPKIRLAG